MDTNTPLSKVALWEQIVGQLRKQIRQGQFQPGEKLPGVRTLAEQFGVCKHTVCTALELLAQDGLIEKQQGRGIFVAHDICHMRFGILSELELFDPSIGAHWLTVASALRQQMQELGAEAHLYMGHAQPRPNHSDEPTCPQFWDDVAAKRLDGAVILNVPSTDAWYFRVQNCPIPVVGEMTGHPVDIDFNTIARVAVERLAQQGCRRLCFMSSMGEDSFRQAVGKFGLHTEEGWIRTDLESAVRGNGLSAFWDIWSATSCKPDGMVVLNDMLFSDAQLALLEMKIPVPESLRVAVLVNRDILPSIRVPVTAFEVDPAERADALLKRLLSRLRGQALTAGMHYISCRERTIQPEMPGDQRTEVSLSALVE